MNKIRLFTQLEETDRVKIEVLLQQGLSYSKIALILDRSVSTISREVRRNQSVRGKRPVYYSARIATKKALLRHRIKPKHNHFNDSMKCQIAEWLLKEKLSPELISIKGRQQRIDFVSHEWIYQWIWSMKFSLVRENKKWQGLYKHLKHGKRRRKRGNHHCKRGNILDRVWIDQRSSIVDGRGRYGDLEADLVLGKNRKPGLLVVLDRKSRKTWIRKLKNKQTRHVINQIKDICRKSEHPIKTITLDNDQAFAEHYKIKQDLAIDTYFTHPYTSQEKGSVENRIGIIRMFFNKKTDFTSITKDEIKSVQNKINNRPMRMFNYKTPNEVFLQSLH
jgi:IS30 family transposase